jgi:hypothetical protein
MKKATVSLKTSWIYHVQMWVQAQDHCSERADSLARLADCDRSLALVPIISVLDLTKPPESLLKGMSFEIKLWVSKPIKLYFFIFKSNIIDLHQIETK